MAAANITLSVLQKNGISQPEYWSKRLLEMIKLERQNFIFTDLGVDMVLPLNEGTTNFTVRRYNSLPYADYKLTEGTTPAGLKPEAHKVTGPVNQYGTFMEETDVAADVHFDNIKSIYQPELARLAAEIIERNVIGSFGDASVYYVGVGNVTVDDIAAGDILKFKDLRTVELTMRNYNRVGHRKYGGKFVNIVHSNVMQDLLDDDVLEKKLMVPGNDNTPIKNGSLAKYLAYNMYYVETLICDVKKNTGGLNVYTSYCLGRDPFMVISLGSSNVKFFDTGFTADKADPLAQKATFGFKLWTGAKVTDPMAITKIFSASSYDVQPNWTTDPAGRPADQS